MAPHSRILAWKIPWTEEPGRLQSMGSLESDTTEWLHFHFSLSCIGEGNGNPLQCSCLENPRDGGAWRAAVYGVTESWTRLKRLSSSSRDHSSIPDQRNCPANMQNDEWKKRLLFEAFSLEFCCTVEATWYMRGLTERKIAGSLKDTRNWDLYSQWGKNC